MDFDHPFRTLCQVNKVHVQEAIDQINTSKQEDIFMTLKPCMIILGQVENDENCFSNLDDPSFLKRLREVDIENLPSNIHKKLENTCNNNLKFNPQKLKKVNQFCSLICEWIHKVVKYQRRKAQEFMHHSPRRNGASPKRYGSPVRLNQTVNTTLRGGNTSIQTYKRKHPNPNATNISTI